MRPSGHVPPKIEFSACLICPLPPGNYVIYEWNSEKKTCEKHPGYLLYDWINRNDDNH